MKKNVIDEMREGHGLTREEAGVQFETVMGSIQKALDRHRKVTIPGFGTFTIKNRAQRNGRNPATGETIIIQARDVIVFKEARGA